MSHHLLTSPGGALNRSYAVENRTDLHRMAKISRRRFLGRCATSTVYLTWCPPVRLGSEFEPLRFGLCADVHKDIMHGQVGPGGGES